MQLTRPFARLPIRFSAEALVAEMAALPDEAWVAHPDGTPGNDAVLLVTPGGRLEQGLMGAMAPTPYLEASPYVRQVMTAIGSVWSRSRLMGLAPGAYNRMTSDLPGEGVAESAPSRRFGAPNAG